MEYERLDVSIIYLFHSPKAYRVLSHLFVLPSMKTLQHDLQKMNIKPGFSGSVFEALTVKAKVMNDRNRNVSLVFDEMSIKQALLYNEKHDTIEGFEDFGFIGKTKYITNHAIAFVVRTNQVYNFKIIDQRMHRQTRKDRIECCGNSL